MLPINDAPVSGDLAYSVDEDGAITLSQAQLLAQATDVEGDALTASNLAVDGNATVTSNEDGSFTITPDTDFNGDIDLTFDINDGNDSLIATADLTVNPINDLPHPQDQAFTIGEDGVLTFTDADLLKGATDIDGDNLSIDGVMYSGPDGVLTDNGEGSYSFAPNENFNGDVNFTFNVFDGTDTVAANIDVTVTPENDPPVAGSTSYTVHEDNSITLSNAQLLANSSDVDGDVGISQVTYSGSDGVFKDNGDGSYTFSPNENFNGDISLDVVVVDADGATDVTTAGITVLDVNDPPVAGTTSYAINEDEVITLSTEQLLANASDIDGEVALDSVNYTGTDGIFTDNGDGTFSFAPNDNFNGDVSLDVIVVDEDGATATTTANIEVLPINDAPQSTVINLSGIEDTSILITQDMLLTNATDIDDTYKDLSAVDLMIDEQYGDLTDHGNGTWTFLPAENFNGDIPMSFGISDGDLVTSIDSNLTIKAVNDAPNVPKIQMQGEEDIVMVIDPAYITNQIKDLDGDNVSIENITVRAPSNATLTQQPDGMYHLVTAQDFNGLVELGYTVTDGKAVVDGSLNVDVIPINDAPFNVGNAFMATDEDGAFTFDASDLINLFGDIDTADLIISRIITNEDSSEVVDNGDGTWTFIPTDNFAGISDLQIVVNDGEFETILDIPVFVRPVADGAVITTSHDGPLVFGEDESGLLSLNVGLIDNSELLNNLVMTGFPVGFEVSDGENTIIITEHGQYIDLYTWDISGLQITPPENFHGEFSVTVTATTVDYGDEPEKVNDNIDSGDFETVMGSSIVLTSDELIALADNVDVDSGDLVKFVQLTDRSQGNIIENNDGSWTFIPTPEFTGEVDVSYVIDKGGVLHDEQTGIVVKDNLLQTNIEPKIDSRVTTELTEGNILKFSDKDMLSTISDVDGSSLTIESVSLVEGKGIIESDLQGNYQFTPAEDYTGNAQVGFIATDEENRIESFFNVDIQSDGHSNINDDYILSDGSLTLTEEQVILELGVSSSAEVLDIIDNNDAGFFSKIGIGEWSYWPNDDFDNQLSMDVEINDNGIVSNHNLDITVTNDTIASNDLNDNQLETLTDENNNIGTNNIIENQNIMNEEDTDIMVSPGSTISINIPEEIISNESIDHVDILGIPNGATINQGLDNGDGSYTFSGDLTQPLSIELPESYEGINEIIFNGFDELDNAIDGTSNTLILDINSNYTNQSNNDNQVADIDSNEFESRDWTNMENDDKHIDFTDDSVSSDSNSDTNITNQDDIDNNLI